MSLSRRCLNLLVNDHHIFPGFKSLRCIDLSRQQLFYPDDIPRPSLDGPSAGSASAQGLRDAATSRPASKMKTIQLPKTCFTFRPGDSDANDEWGIHCFPLAGRGVVCADQSGRGFVIDPDTGVAGTMPPLHKPKRMPLSLFIPRPDVDHDPDNDGFGSSLFVMERFPEPEHGEESDQFEAIIFRNVVNHKVIAGKDWHCDRLPPPPFVRKTCNGNNKSRTEIAAYAVVGGGSDICISAEGAGTYLMDTASHAWTQVGDWTLPFYGKVEFVPELNLWFGLSADAKALAAADLSQSAMDSRSRPQLVGPWKELDGVGAAPEECQDSQLVNLGAGRFCIARFFQAATEGDSGGYGLANKSFVVLTGVEVVPHAAGDGNGNGVMELQMMKHRSRRLDNTHYHANIEAVF